MAVSSIDNKKNLKSKKGKCTIKERKEKEVKEEDHKVEKKREKEK